MQIAPGLSAPAPGNLVIRRVSRASQTCFRKSAPRDLLEGIPPSPAGHPGSGAPGTFAGLFGGKNRPRKKVCKMIEIWIPRGPNIDPKTTQGGNKVLPRGAPETAVTGSRENKDFANPWDNANEAPM